MDFLTTQFELSCFNIQEKLGISKEIEVDYWKSSNRSSEVRWNVDIDVRQWGIKSINIIPTILNIWIDWEISLSDLSHDEINKLLQHQTLEFYPTYLDNNTIRGTIKINQNNYEITNNIEVKNNLLMIEEVYVDFKSSQINII